MALITAEARPVAQLLYGSASHQPGGLIELARLPHLAVGDAGDAPRRLEVIAGE